MASKNRKAQTPLPLCAPAFSFVDPSLLFDVCCGLSQKNLATPKQITIIFSKHFLVVCFLSYLWRHKKWFWWNRSVIYRSLKSPHLQSLCYIKLGWSSTFPPTADHLLRKLGHGSTNMFGYLGCNVLFAFHLGCFYECVGVWWSIGDLYNIVFKRCLLFPSNVCNMIANNPSNKPIWQSMAKWHERRPVLWVPLHLPRTSSPAPNPQCHAKRHGFLWEKNVSILSLRSTLQAPATWTRDAVSPQKTFFWFPHWIIEDYWLYFSSQVASTSKYCGVNSASKRLAVKLTMGGLNPKRLPQMRC